MKKQKGNILRGQMIGIFLCLAMILISIPSQKVEAAKRKITSISIENVDNKKITLEKGKTYQLKAKIAPSNATYQKLKWSSSKKSVVSVSKSGKIKALKKGKAKIKATTLDGSKKTATITVTVGTRVKKVTITTKNRTIKEGTSFTIAKKVAPSNASNKSLIYTSSNKSVAKVSAKGVVTAGKVPSGKTKKTVTITVRSADGGKVKDTIKVTVKKKSTTSTASPITNKVAVTANVPMTMSRFVGHMGYSAVAPANSIPSYTKAGESKAFMGIECDVNETKDGEFVLYHDDTLQTRTNGTGQIRSLNLSAIQAVNLIKGNNISLFPSLKIPTLKEYLYVCKVYGMRPVLHIKYVSTQGVTRLLNLIESVGMKDQAYITGSKAYMTRFREKSSTVPLYWLCNLSTTGIDWAAANNIQLNSDYKYVTKDLVNYAHSKGLAVGAWTVNSKTTAQNLLNMGVDFITTDNNLTK